MGTVIVTKKFDKNLYRKYDAEAKRVALHFFNRKESNFFDFVTVNSDQYGIDLLAIEDDKPIFGIDVEVKNAWKRDFPFKEVNLPARKRKFQDRINCYFAILNFDLSKILIIPGRLLTQDRKKLLNNKYKRQEAFYRIPVELCQIHNLQ